MSGTMRVYGMFNCCLSILILHTKVFMWGKCEDLGVFKILKKRFLSLPFLASA